MTKPLGWGLVYNPTTDTTEVMMVVELLPPAEQARISERAKAAMRDHKKAVKV